VEVEAATAATGEAAHARAATHVVLPALVRMGEGLVGLGDPHELLGRLGVRIDVRVERAGELAVRLLDLISRRFAGDAEEVVVIVVHCSGVLTGESVPRAAGTGRRVAWAAGRG